MLMLALNILLSNHTHFKKIRQFENLVFVIMSTRENKRLIARAPRLVGWCDCQMFDFGWARHRSNCFFSTDYVGVIVCLFN